MKKIKAIHILALFIFMLACTNKPVIITDAQLTNDIFYYKNSYKPYTGLCEIKYSDTDNTKMLLKFKDGVLHGKVQCFYPDGTLKLTGFYKNGLYAGTWEGWYPSGEKEYEICYENDSLNGKYIVYYRNGNVREQGKYAMNQKSGAWQYFNPKGQRIEKDEIAFTNGDT